MENPVDHTIDLGLVNYVQHPENPNYIVFRFSDLNRAKSFEDRLRDQSIWYEKGEEEKRGKMVQLYGIHKSDYKKVTNINYLVEASHKKPLIPWSGLRYGLVSSMVIMIILASVGYCKQQDKLRLHNQKLKSSETEISKP